jgi:hypothetical protein
MASHMSPYKGLGAPEPPEKQAIQNAQNPYMLGLTDDANMKDPNKKESFLN